MTRSVRLYTATQFEEVKTLVDLMTERSDLPPAERGKPSSGATEAEAYRRQRTAVSDNLPDGLREWR